MVMHNLSVSSSLRYLSLPSAAYGEDEPEYPLAAIREPNPKYE